MTGVADPYSTTAAEDAAYSRFMADVAASEPVSVPFRAAEGKALQSVTELADGDLLIEGWCVRYDTGPDRQNEAFADGSLDRGVKAFLNGTATLAYHHKHEHALGKVLDLRPVPGKGVWLKARVDGALRRHPQLTLIYEQIKRGTLNALSVGGFFKRKLTEAGPRIVGVDLTEISVTPVPVGHGTSFGVVAGKALMDAPGAIITEADLALLRARVIEIQTAALRSEIRSLRWQR